MSRAVATGPTFIETQFPVSKLSKESYKERMANYSQTLTGLGKWWGRKPLIMVRAILLGLLMPASDDPVKDRQVFLQLLTMDPEGMWRRKDKGIPLRQLYARLSPAEREEWFDEERSTPDRPRYQRGTGRETKLRLQRRVFDRLSYDEKLTYCGRPEHLDGPSEEAWGEINTHLGTHATSLPELVDELGRRRFGHPPRVGDAFCGGGSVPFEAARIGCEAYGSDLNPVAALLTWGALNIVGGGEEVAAQVRAAQEEVFTAVDEQVTAWGIEHNEAGWRADAYLYCAETRCPECGWLVPLAPAWVVGEKSRTIATLVPDPATERFTIEIHQGVSRAEVAAARRTGTVRNARLHCPNCLPNTTAIATLRGDASSHLRLWENDDLVPRPDDLFLERLYCIRWVHTWTEWIDDQPVERRERLYRAPTSADLDREGEVLALLQERFHDWQEAGYLPSRRIEPGNETTRLMRERGWTHWHHLFTPRQLLILGLLGETAVTINPVSRINTIACVLGVARCTNWTSRLTGWDPSAANEKSNQTFQNQALNTMSTYAVRPLSSLDSAWFLGSRSVPSKSASHVTVADARVAAATTDLWVTDPPYADAVNYHELSEFFLAWYEKHLPRLFPEWYADSKRALAITGSGQGFRQAMVESYRNLADHMADNGMQVVMFTHQDAGVWADLALIVWAAGLRVTAAWTIATETVSALKTGNYVKGTVLMVLRKQTSEETTFLDTLVPQVEVEVERQLDAMLALDDREDPNFADSDYQLAAYAAALRVLTRYKGIGDLDIAYELTRERGRGEVSPIEKIIADAVKTASNHLIPKGLDGYVWKRLAPAERFYLKGLEVEGHGELRAGVYQEFARGFGVRDYQPMLQSGKANQTRLKTASELGRRDLGSDGFGKTVLRDLLFALFRVADSEEIDQGMVWLRTEVRGYWQERERILALLRFLGRIDIDHWQADAAAARLLAGAVENDHV